jgi:phage virion morphogenesis protein
MAGVSLPVTVDQAAVADIGKRLDRLRGRVADMTPVYDEIGGSLVTSTLYRFEKGVGPDGSPWRPSIRALQTNGQTLVDSGHLRQSITHRAERDKVTIGSNRVYAAIHQFGGKAGRGGSATMPARPFIGLSKDDTAETGAILGDWLAEPFSGGGAR